MEIHDIFETIEFSGLTYDEDMMFYPEKVNEFKNKAALRDETGNAIKEIQLKRVGAPRFRHSTREFDLNKLVSPEDFSAFLECLELVDTPDEFHQEFQFQYPSAGGLYPIDVYVYVKENRVEGIEAGIYEYNRIHHSLCLKSKDEVPVTTHYYNNREIFKGAAFSVYFFYNPKFSFPKYGGMGFFYGMLDCGIMMELLEQRMDSCNLGGCIIGDMDYKKIKPFFNEQLVYLGAMELGYPKEQKEDEA